MKIDDNTNLVACQRVYDAKSGVPSVIRQCACCKEDVYVSHSTLARIEKEGDGKAVMFACLECLPTIDIDLSDTLKPSEEQLKEIEAAKGMKLSEKDIARGFERFKHMYRIGRSGRN